MQRKSRIFQVGLGTAFGLLLTILSLCCYCNNLYKKRHFAPNRNAHDADQSMTKSSNDRVSLNNKITFNKTTLRKPVRYKL